MITVSAGTQVVVALEVRGTNDAPVHPRGAVGISRLIENPTSKTRETLNALLIRLRLNAGSP